MAKGFKDDKGKFRPTGTTPRKRATQFFTQNPNLQGANPDIKKANELKKEKGRIKETRIFKFEDLDPEVQEKVLEKERQAIAEFNENFFAEDEGIIFDEDEKKDGQDIGLKNLFPTAFDVGSNRGEDFIQFELEINDKKKFAKYLGLSDKVLKKVDIEFQNHQDNFGSDNTRLQFTDNTGGNIDLSPDIAFIDEHYDEGNIDEDERIFQKEDIPTVAEGHEILNAHDKFADLMDMSLRNLTRNYESQFEEETIKENLDANQREFEEDGTPA